MEQPVDDLPEFYWREVVRRRILEDREIAGSVLLAFISPPPQDTQNGIPLSEIFLFRESFNYSIFSK